MAAAQLSYSRTKYSKELCESMPGRFKGGASITEVCQEIGITKKTYALWKEKHKEWNEVTQFAEEASEAFYWKYARGYLFGNGKYKMDTGLFCFIMKTRFKYRETDYNVAPDNTTSGQPLTIKFEVKPAVGEVTVTNANTDA